MRIGIIGGSGHFRYALDQLALHGVVGIAPGIPGEDLSKLQKALEKRKIEAPLFDCWDALLDQIEVAVVNTAFHKNAEVTARCLERGIFVFSEKPLAVNEAQLQQLRQIQERSAAFVCGMFGIRYSGWFLTLREAVTQIGTIRLLNGQKSYKLGTRNEYYHRQETFGGIIPWVAIHAVDWICALTGKQVLSVTGLTDNAFNGGNGDMEMTSLCQLLLEDGILASVSADFFRPVGAPTHDDDRIRVVGTKGIAEYQNGQVTLITEEGSRTLPLLPSQDVFALFLRRVGGEAVGVTPEESFALTEIVLRAEADAHKRKQH